MDFCEIYTWPLTSETTCYSSPRRIQGESVSLATEHHILRLNLSDHSWQDQRIEHSACVGYDTNGDFQVIALLDPADLTSQEDVPQSLTDASTTCAATVSSTAPTSTAGEGQQQSQQGSSSSHHRRSPSGLSVDNLGSLSTLPPNNNPEDIVLLPQAAELLLYQQTIQIASVHLDFRPLAPTLMNRYIWLGSADHNKLLLYQYDNQEHSNRLLRLVELDHPAFAFLSPVMALDVVEVEAFQYCLAVACQDGTIRLIQFELENDLICKVTEYTVIVDGPLVCIQVDVVRPTITTDSAIHVVVGSLCGYICEFEYNHGTWEGPTLVAEGFWNKDLDLEDSVLSVVAHHDQIAAGLHSGRCLVYRKTKNDAYVLEWQVVLPYSVQGAALMGGDRLLVTTRRSIHLFQGKRVQYNTDGVKQRLEARLNDRTVRNEGDLADETN